MRKPRISRAALARALAVAAAITIAGAGVIGYPPARAAVLGQASNPGGPAGPVPAAVLSSSVAPGTADAGIAAPLVVTAAHGTLGTVAATGPRGEPLPGTLSPDRTTWTSAPLSFGHGYHVTATGTGNDGRPAAPLDCSFHTVEPAHTLQVSTMRPTDGDVVGIAMPISIYFSGAVTDRASVERTLRITPSVPTIGSFYWVNSRRVDWRPKDFWTAGTTVRVDSALRGVAAGPGTYGASDTTATFTIGAAHQAIGDAVKHTLTLYENGRVVHTLPASFGQPRYQTHSGIHVAMQKFPVKEMRSDSWAGGPHKGDPGYYDVFEPLAVRISNNGEFVHVNNLTVRQQGRSNVSHGCVNLSMANGRVFYSWVQVGDPVEIVGTSVPLSASEGDIADWVIPWERYLAGSALAGATEAPNPGSFSPVRLPD